MGAGRRDHRPTTPTPKETDMRKMSIRKSDTVALSGNTRRLWFEWCW
ncbi:hypothetical protein GCM10009639_42490 [Kitasatospora putterlickiae]|uniref:Uncharacterized protein n=1 Tax=Kitasatospora putterlickiae TaxID=221725 RepID=A0ABN1Y8L9_9ACTN